MWPSIETKRFIGKIYQSPAFNIRQLKHTQLQLLVSLAISKLKLKTTHIFCKTNQKHETAVVNIVNLSCVPFTSVNNTHDNRLI